MEKPCQSDHGDYRDGCVVCWKWRHDPAFAVFHDGHVETPTTPAPSPQRKPCRFRGGKLLSGEAARLGLDARRDWFECGHPEQPLGSVVSPCKGCNSSCRGYSG